MITVALLVGSITTVIAINAANGESDREIKEMLQIGYHFLEDMNYEQAVVSFENIISIDKKSVPAYSGCAIAYVGLNNVENAARILENGYVQTESDILQSMSDVIVKGENITDEFKIICVEDKVNFSEEIFDSLKLLKSPYYTWDFNACANIFNFDYESYAGQRLNLGTYNGYNVLFDAKTENIEFHLTDSATDYGYKLIGDSQLQIFSIHNISEPLQMNELSEVEVSYEMGTSQKSIESAIALNKIMTEEKVFYSMDTADGLVTAIKWRNNSNTYIYVDKVGDTELSIQFCFAEDALKTIKYTCGIPDNLKSKLLNFVGETIN